MGQFLQLHETPTAFRQALSFTEAESGFAQRLIEKDYYCSLILADFEPLFANGLVFKGGTSLSKVHADFYRLSEDLDFAISIATTARKSDRRRAVAPIKQHLEQITDRLTTVSACDPLKGHDTSRQYNAVLQYESAVTGENETVKVQVSVREPILEATVSRAGRTLLRHPVPGEAPDAKLSLRVLSLRETYAEKVRAALTRNPPAIRDIFDIGDAVRAERLDLFEPRFLSLVRQKLAVPGNVAINTSPTRRKSVEDQLETHLKPVLRSSDYAAFDIERAFAEVEKLAAMI
ncbi:MAG: nucleotidyl transferase AbiEii/AbiGii toxin family protein [Planctomycetes bacterium]|nr:nucleotidyl transferase AbiEii/AbiGii toxin family protein [Planctomycetota bacterium]